MCLKRPYRGGAMEALVNNITQYIEFLVLGAVGMLALSIPITHRHPLTRGWRFLVEQVLPGKEPDHYSRFIKVGLAGGLLFAIFYFAGHMLYSFGQNLLQPAHMAVVHESSLVFA